MKTIFDYKHYVPILRWKQGEQLALKELFPTDRSLMTPLVELPSDYEKTIDETVNAVAKNWGSAAMFFDVRPILHRRDPAWRKNHVTAFFNEARNAGLELTPVTGLDCSVEYRTEVRNVIEVDQRGACIRLNRAYLGRPNLRDDLLALLANLGIEPKMVDVVLDLQICDGTNQNYAGFCGALPNLSDWRTLTVAGGAFPEDLTEFTVGRHDVRRHDWLSYRNTIKAQLPRRPTYGDYATLHPFLKPDMQGLNPSASIRYTSEECWVVMRGEGLRNKTGAGHAQYPANAKLLTDSLAYCGQYFSFGDNYIYEVSLNKGKTGNPRTWVTAGVNHHLTFAVRQINRIFNDSPKLGT